MALQGNLTDIGMTDLFQLIGAGHKSGTLHIDSNGHNGYVCFQEGKVFFAISNWNRESLGKRLVKAGKITQKQLKQALGLHKIQKKEKGYRRLGQIMVDEGYINRRLLEDFVREQIFDTLFDLMRWEMGKFSFEAEEIFEDEDIGISVSVENIIMEASRRLEVWKTIKQKMPDFRVRFRKAMRPSEDKFEVHLEPREWKLLRFINGNANIEKLIELSGFNDFETCKVLYGLYSAGLIEKNKENIGDKRKQKKIDKMLDEIKEKKDSEPEVKKEKVTVEENNTQDNEIDEAETEKEGKDVEKAVETRSEQTDEDIDFDIYRDKSIDEDIVELVIDVLDDL